MQTCETLLASVQKIKFFTDEVKTKQKFHITIGHQTAIGLVHFFSSAQNDKLIFNQGNLKSVKNDFKFDFSQTYDDELSLVGDALPG